MPQQMEVAIKKLIALCLLLGVAVSSLAETRAPGAFYSPEKLKEMSTLVFSGTVLKIETDLGLDPEDPSYQKGSVDSLIAAAVSYVDDHPHFQTIEIEPSREGRLEVTSLGV